MQNKKQNASKLSLIYVIQSVNRTLNSLNIRDLIHQLEDDEKLKIYSNIILLNLKNFI